MKHPELSDQQSEQLKLELINKKNQLEEQLNLFNKEDSRAESERDAGESEDADGASEQTIQLENDLKADRAGKSLGQVQKALARMDSGEYGLCEVCNEPISLPRLQAFPEATTCVNHAA